MFFRNFNLSKISRNMVAAVTSTMLLNAATAAILATLLIHAALLILTAVLI